MSELQKQAMEIIEEMSEENLKVLVKFMQIFIQPSRTSCEGTDTHSVKKSSKRIGIAEGEELYAADYDIDEYNGEIAKMFGGGIMKVLLDTHIVLWTLENNVKLPEKARDIIENEDNQIYYSTASVWKIAIKHMAHPDKMLIGGRSFSEKCMGSGFVDRIMLSQAKADGLKFITHDSLIPYYNEECILAV